MRLALFPLDLVLFPGAVLPLHVFEERYREMIGRCISDDDDFGVARIKAGDEVGGYAETETVGTVASIVQHRRLPDGRYVLLAAGGDRFRIVERLPDDPFPAALVEVVGPEAGVVVEADLLDDVVRLARRYTGLAAEAGLIDPGVSLDVADEPETASFAVAAALALPGPDRQVLLELGTADRLMRLRRVLTAENDRLVGEILSR
ncbi:MAG: LON peptidase substrate-binding domain-containing protein [Acidimicrobiia bacterium]|nr:LON peptidase substrate-binding domain-containing protein [Acidimicrobiia bacterium]